MFLDSSNSFILCTKLMEMADLCLLHAPRHTNSVSAMIEEATEQEHPDCVQVQDSLSGTLHEALMKAARQGQLGLLTYLFKLETTCFLGDLHGPLCEAMFHGHTHVMKFLTASAANIDGKTPLMLATKQQDVKMVKSVLQAGANVNRINQKTGGTALMESALNGCVQITLILIEAGANVNMADKSGHTSLMFAVHKRHLKVAEILIREGADVNKICYVRQTALLHCTSTGCEEGVEMLVESGADVNTVDKFLNTALILASEKGFLSIVEFLVKRGADVNKVSQLGDTALTIAVRNGNLNITNILLQAAANVKDPSINCTSNGNEEWTPLLAEEAEVNTRDNHNHAALLIAIESGYFNIAKVLIDAGTDVNTLRKESETALSHFALKGNEQAVRFLLRSGAKVNIGKQPTGPLEPNIWLLLRAEGHQMTASQRNKKKFLKDTLHYHCRMAIRRHLLELDPHENLFLRIPRLGLPSGLVKYLLCDASLD